MNMLPWSYIGLIVLSVCPGIVHAAPSKEVDERIIRSMVDQVIIRLNRGDLTAFDDFWDEDADYVGVDAVEIDSTFYATPNVSVVRSWNAKTPEGFLFAAKVPQEITHKRVLKDCDEEFKVFLTTMEALGEKLGALLFQFGKFGKAMFRSLDDFLGRLVPFLKKLPKEHKFAVEIRNKDWPSARRSYRFPPTGTNRTRCKSTEVPGLGSVCSGTELHPLAVSDCA
jgi:hypothetical protein